MGKNEYRAKVVAATRANGQTILYDIVRFTRVNFLGNKNQRTAPSHETLKRGSRSGIEELFKIAGNVTA